LNSQEEFSPQKKQKRTQPLDTNPNPPNTASQEKVVNNDGWEGIDPSLLEEFKDIVDFF
jgi:hypothetical protein